MGWKHNFFLSHLYDMNDYWHIPRASLSPSSASSAVSSASSTHRSNRSSLSSHGKQQKPTPTHHQRSQALPRQATTTMQGHTSVPLAAGGRLAGGRRSDSEITNTKVTTNSSYLATAKRGSRSSQGSNDSSNSTRSAASGSLLLTAANLERMTEIHRKQQKQQHHNRFQQSSTLQNVTSTAAAHSTANYNANLMHAAACINNNSSGIKAITSADTAANQHNTANHDDAADSIINIDPNLDFVKTKDLDTVSIASSMHFTMVNGEAGTNKKTKKGLCDRGRQVTVLIVSMSTIFLLLIMGMVYALEMRARDMPHS